MVHLYAFERPATGMLSVLLQGPCGRPHSDESSPEFRASSTVARRVRTGEGTVSYAAAVFVRVLPGSRLL